MLKKKGFIACLVGSLLSLAGCAPKKLMPAGDLVRVMYTQTGTMAGYEYAGRVEQDSVGTFVLTAMKENYGPMFEKRIDAETMKQFRQIIEEEGMYAYKDSYEPKYVVYDGTMWSFSAGFSDGNSIMTGGSNEWPKGNGLDRIIGYMKQLVEDGVQTADTGETW